MVTPYILPAQLIAAPLGISWSTLPSKGATPQQQYAAVFDICMRATGAVDEYCDQVLRATQNTEEVRAPDYRVTVDNTGITTVLTSRWPVLSCVAGSVSPAAAFPPSWTPIPATAMRPAGGMDTIYGSIAQAQASGPYHIEIAPGFVNRYWGRNAWRLMLVYLNGWPHGGLTASVAAGASVIPIDDCTGWAGAAGTIYDGASTEAVAVLSTSASIGPGNATLAAPLQFAHGTPVMVSSLPADVQWGTMLMAAAQALTRGATATTVQGIPGAGTSGGTKAPEDLASEAEVKLAKYKRIL